MAHRLQHKPTHLSIKLLFLGPMELYTLSTRRTFYCLSIQTHVFVSNTYAFLNYYICSRLFVHVQPSLFFNNLDRYTATRNRKKNINQHPENSAPSWFRTRGVRPERRFQTSLAVNVQV